MKLTHLNIKNFRGINDLSLPLGDLCVFIGENNVGKSTILDAIRICLTSSYGRRRPTFDEYDYHLRDENAEPVNSPPIEITLHFAEQQDDEWPIEISQRLSDVEQIDDDNRRSVKLRVTSEFNHSIGDYETKYDFLDLSGNYLNKKNPRMLNALQQLVPTFYLSSLRTAAQEFRVQSQFWGPFVRSLDIDDESREELEAELTALNERVLQKHQAFNVVKNELGNASKLLPLNDTDPVSIEAIPTKVFDILSRTQINLSSKSGAQIPIIKHGSGTQSVAVIHPFKAFLKSQLNVIDQDSAEPLLALEEPEAHLHPSAAKAVAEMLQQLSGQKLVSTHSGDLLAGVPLESIRRLRRVDGKISVYRVEKDTLTEDERNKLDYQIRTTHGSLLFSKCWLLVEGQSEVPLVTVCAREMGYDLHADGVSCVEFAQIGVEKLIKLADPTWDRVVRSRRQ